MLNSLTGAKVGDLVYFVSEVRPYRIRARNKRFIICTKPFNARKTVLYTVIDLLECIRGPDNMIFGMGYETEEQIAERMAEFERGELEVSRRRSITLDAYDVKGG